MKIAIASSGLGYIQRGIEAWAKSLAEGLSREGLNVILYHGGKSEYNCEHKALKYKSRFSFLYRFLEKNAPAFTWRWGWKSSYVMEQKSFAKALIMELKKNPVDIVHTQDIYVAKALVEAHRQGVIKNKTILAHGTDEKLDVLRNIEYLQHLAPFYKEEAERLFKNEKQEHFFIPNFVDTEKFYRFSDDERSELRRKNNVPYDCLAVGAVGAVKLSHKRMDAVIRECSLLVGKQEGVYLIIAGAETDETAAIKTLADKLLKGNYQLLLNKNFDEMPSFYNMLDVYVHPAAGEFFGIAIIEAMACGVPVVVNNTPPLEWIVGNGGWMADVKEEGFLEELFPEIQANFKEKGLLARERVEKEFSWQAVYPKFMEMYEMVLK